MGKAGGKKLEGSQEENLSCLPATVSRRKKWSAMSKPTEKLQIETSELNSKSNLGRMVETKA